ncbi:MAG: carboxymuconolactone decarboxylase [Novosphingobium sp.]|nr:carboxymuconolactone decarboxylase [Novosphingobium sp.]
MKDAAARQAEVLDSPQRIAPLPRDEFPPEATALALLVRDALGYTEDIIPDYFATMFRHPLLYRLQMEAGAILLGSGAIPPRERELAVLRVAWLCGAPYEWSSHVDIGRTLGLNEADIERVIAGSAAEGWSDHERAILRGAEELVCEHMLSDETWALLARSWDEPQLIEFPALVGNYITIALVQNSLRIRLNEGSLGLMER